MGEPPEACDDRAVLVGVVEVRVARVTLRQNLVERHATVLVREVLAVHEGQVEEAALDRADLGIEPAFDGLPRRTTRRCILREGAAIGPKQIA